MTLLILQEYQDPSLCLEDLDQLLDGFNLKLLFIIIKLLWQVFS